MRDVVNDEGRLVGVVNAVDAVIVVALLLVAAGGLWVVMDEGAATQTATVTVETGAPAYVVDAINASDRPADEDVRAVGAVEIREAYRSNASAAGYVRPEFRVRFAVDLAVSARDGALYFRGERLYVGRAVDLDLGTTVVDADVVSIEGGGGDA